MSKDEEGPTAYRIWLSNGMIYAEHVIAFLTALWSAFPYWVGVYVPMIMPYYLYPFGAMLGFHVAACNDYLNWNSIRYPFLGLNFLMSLLSIVSFIFYMVEWTYKPDLITDPDRFNGTYYSSFLGGEYPPLIVTTSSTASPDSWWIFQFVWAIICIAWSFIHMLVSLVILGGETTCCANEQIHSDVSISAFPRERLRESDEHFSTWPLRGMAIVIAVYLIVSQVVSYWTLVESTAMINQDQNATFLIFYILMAATELPISSVFYSKAKEFVKIDPKTFELKEPLKKQNAKAYEIQLELFYHTDNIKEIGLDEVSKVWNKTVILIVGQFEMSRFAHLPILVFFSVASMAMILINFTQQYLWLINGENKLYGGICGFTNNTMTSLTLNYFRTSNLTIEYTFNSTAHENYNLTTMSTFTCMDVVGSFIGLASSLVALILISWYSSDGDPNYGTYRKLRNRLVRMINNKDSGSEIAHSFDGRPLSMFVIKFGQYIKGIVDPTTNKISPVEVKKYMQTYGVWDETYSNLSSKTSSVYMKRKQRDLL